MNYDEFIPVKPHLLGNQCRREKLKSYTIIYSNYFYCSLPFTFILHLEKNNYRSLHSYKRLFLTKTSEFGTRQFSRSF